jgi:hypothetical protein
MIAQCNSASVRKASAVLRSRSKMAPSGRRLSLLAARQRRNGRHDVGEMACSRVLLASGSLVEVGQDGKHAAVVAA